jgi:hypothetical protein
VITAGCGSSSVDSRRLKILSHDPLAVAQAPHTTPWIPANPTPEHREANGVVGNDDGIGFGGITATSLQVRRHVQGSPRAALRFYAQTAIRAGWSLHVGCHRWGDVFTAIKQFPGWVAGATVGDSPIDGQPAVAVIIETAWHGETTPAVHAPLAVATLEALAQTCLGA